MKMRHVVAVTSAVLISFGAYAGGQQQSSSGSTTSQAAVVQQVQEKLASAGFEPTPRGLRDFQQSKGLEASGQLDIQTLAALGIDAGASAGPGASSEPASERAGEPAQPKGQK